MLVNRTVKTEIGEALTEVARLSIPAGLELLAVGIALSDDANLDQFEVRGKIGDIEFTFANAQADFETPEWPLKRASGDLTVLAADTAGYVVLDVRGLSEVALYGAGAAAGPTTVTVNLYG